MAGEYNKRTALSASTVAAVAEAPTTKGLRCHVNVVNRGDTPRKVRLHIGTSTTAADADYIEYDAIVSKGKPLIRGPLVLKANEKIYARADGADCNVVAMGEEAWTA